MEPDDLAQLAQRAYEEAQEALGEDADGNELARYIVGGIDDETMDALMNYMTQGVHQHIFEHLIQGDMEAGLSPSDLIRATLMSAVPTLLMLSRQLWKQEQSAPVADKYIATMGAELSLQNWISDGKSLSDIWPTEYAQEVAQTFDGDLTKVFLAGVMCGRNHG